MENYRLSKFALQTALVRRWRDNRSNVLPFSRCLEPRPAADVLNVMFMRPEQFGDGSGAEFWVFKRKLDDLLALVAVALEGNAESARDPKNRRIANTEPPRNAASRFGPGIGRKDLPVLLVGKFARQCHART